MALSYRVRCWVCFAVGCDFPKTTVDEHEPEPKWPGFAALLAVGGIHYALPSALSVGPQWLVLALLLLFIIPKVIVIRQGNDRVHRILGHMTSSLVTADMAGSLG